MQAQEVSDKSTRGVMMFEDQSLTDLLEVLNSKTPEFMQVKIFSLEHIGALLIRETFRRLLNENYFDINKVIEKSSVMTKLIQNDVKSSIYEKEIQLEFLSKNLKLVALGVKDSLAFLWELHNKYLNVTIEE